MRLVKLTFMPLVMFFSAVIFFSVSAQDTPQTAKEELKYRIERKKMVENAIVGYGINDTKIVKAFLNVPRHEFVSPEAKDKAYEDKAMPIGNNQTMGRPYEVARMTQLLGLTGTEKVLELGTGSGYHTAVLSRLCADIYTVDIQDDMLKKAKARLQRLGYKNIHFRLGQGTLGWPEEAPFDAIVVGFAADSIIDELIKQLKEGGKLVIPVADSDGTQKLKLVIKKNGAVQVKDVIKVTFSSMIKEGKDKPAVEPVPVSANTSAK
jgi:protein-L-isoaspartate(D-aspartate) O-methyltransferase